MEKPASWMTEHWRARRNFGKKLGKCELCKVPKRTEIHHRNEDWHDNRRENLQEVCRKCHYRIHNPIKVCEVPNCGKKRRRHGYCEKHSQRFEKWGNPLAFKRNQHTPIVFVD